MLRTKIKEREQGYDDSSYTSRRKEVEGKAWRSVRIFKLFYDTVGCGCDGINVLLIVSEVEQGDSRIETNSLPFIVSRQQEIFYEDKLRLDAEERFSSYKLVSDSQIYGNNIMVRDMRNVSTIQGI